MRIKKRKSNFSRFKRGNAILDAALIIVVLFAFITLNLNFGGIFKDIKNDLNADADFSTEGKAIVTAQEARYGSLMDGFFMLIFILLWAGGIVASFMIDSHPIFFVFTMILLIGIFVVAAFLGNAYEEIIQESGISASVASYPMANWIMTHFLIVFIVVGFSLGIVVYAKSRSG